MADLLVKAHGHKEPPYIPREIIDIEDFNTEFPNMDRLKKLFFTLRLSEENKEIEKYRGMTFDELRMNKIISDTDGKPSPFLTDEKWQKEFSIRKMFVKPYPKSFKRLGKIYKETKCGIYTGQTNWQMYVSYINSVLSNIRKNQVDYCYFIYQIMELARFHPTTLKTKYRDGYWEVWINR